MRYLLALLLFLQSSVACTMEQMINHEDKNIEWLALPKDLWIQIIACCNAKNALSKTDTSFHTFITKNKEKILQHPSLTLSNTGLETLFLYYGAMGDKTITQNLLAKGVDPNICDDKKITVMDYAAQYGYVDIVDLLLQHPDYIINDITKDNAPPSALYRAIHCNQNAIVKRITVKYKVHKGNLLCEAVKQNSLNCVRTLLTCDFDVNSPDTRGFYPLHWAALNGYIHIVRFLIANDANVDCRSTINQHLNSTPLHFAAFYGHTNVVQLLIDHGTNINLKDTKGFTSLHTASQKEHLPVIETLLKNNARVDERTNMGYTPLHYASYNEHTQIIEVLLKHNAPINVQTNFGRTPLDLVKRKRVRKLLIAHGGKTEAELHQLQVNQENM